MIGRPVAFLLVLFVALPRDVRAQCGVADFELPSSLCVSQNLKIKLNSVGETTKWDLCSHDLKQNPMATKFLSNANSAFNLALVEQGGNFFGFYLSRGSAQLVRLDFGNDPTGTPSQVNLGNLGVSGPGWLSIKIVVEQGQYVGLAIDFFNKVYRFRIGPTITDPPSPAEVIYENGLLAAPIALDVAEDESGKYAFVANLGSNNLTKLSFGASFLAVPSAIEKANIVLPGVPLGLSMLQDCNKWFGMFSNGSNSSISKLKFSNGLDNPPQISDVEGISFSLGAPGGISLVNESGNFYSFAVSRTNGSLYRFDFGNSLDNLLQQSSDLGNFGMLNDIWGFSMHKVGSRWLVNASENTGASMYKITFPNNCLATSEFSADLEPKLNVVNAGTFSISVEVTDHNGITSYVTKNVVVIDSPAPQIDFSIDGACASQELTFTMNGSDITDQTWLFGDGQSSSDLNPAHQYLAEGQYLVSLEVEAQNGCRNMVEKLVKIYRPPQASFTLPSGIVCTNNEFVFTNATQGVYDGLLTYQWILNNEQVSTQRDLNYTFTSGGDKEIKLVTSIPGCSSEFIQTIPDVGEGPVVNFDISGKCAGEPISFNNQSTGDIAGYEWSLGTTPSSELSPTISFPSAGSYNTSLKATGTNGCVSETSKPLKIYSKPVASFSLALPPFSCSGSPAQFTDTTPALTDSNLTGWAWSFGMGLGTSTQRNPSFTFAQAGNYPVELTITSDQGCFATLTKSITIQQTPTVDFTNGPSCRNQRTQFTSITSAPIKSFQWNIGVNTYTTANPSHVFVTAGNSVVQVRIVAQNDCVSTISKSITIPVELSPEFTVGNACAGKQIVFSNSTVAPNDPVRNVQWIINNQSLQGNTVNLVLANPGNYPVRMVVAGQSGCTYGIDQNVVINPTPSAGFAMSDEVGPPPLRVLFTNTSQGANSFLWRFNDNLGTTSSNANPEFTFTALGDYGVDLIASNSFNCSDQITRLVRIITPVRDLELIDYRVLQDPVSKLFVSQVEIKNNSNYIVREAPVLLNLGLGITFREVVRDQWLPGTTKTITLQNQLQTSRPLTFACAELAFPDDQVASNNKICISLNESSNWLPAYPNPADGFLIVPLIAASKEPVTIRLITGTGALAYEKIIDNPDLGLREWTIAINQLVPGLYTLVVQTGGSENRSRVLIKR